MASLTAPSHSKNQTSALAHEPIVCEYIPKQILKQYHTAKIAFSLMMLSVFGWWMYIHQGNVTMQVITVVVMLLTLWITYTSIHGETSRDHNRQIAATQNSLIIQADDKKTIVPIDQIKGAFWTEDTYDNQGLHIVNHQDQTIAHIDGQVLSNQEDARRFLRWLRQDAQIIFDVQWNA